jgi:hypothetical protein
VLMHVFEVRPVSTIPVSMPHHPCVYASWVSI